MFSFLKHGKLFLKLSYFNPYFCHFLQKIDLRFSSGSKGSHAWHSNFTILIIAIFLTSMNFIFFPEAREITHKSLLFQSMLLLFCWHQWLLFSFWKQEKLFITFWCINPSFCYFLHIKNFCFRSGSRGSSSKQFAISINVSAIFLTKVTFVFVIEVGEVIHNTFPFQPMFLQFPWHKWLLLSFWKQSKVSITSCYFNPCFCYFLDINDFSFRSGKRRSYLSHFSISIYVSAICLTKVTCFCYEN